MVLNDSRQRELIGLLEAGVADSSEKAVAAELGVVPRTIRNAIRAGKVPTPKHALYIEKLDRMLGNTSCIPADIGRKLAALRLAWFAPRNDSLVPTWIRDNASILEDSCSYAWNQRVDQPDRFIGYSLVLGIAYLYQGILCAKKRDASVAANTRALRHLQNAHEFGANRLSAYLADRLAMQISCAVFNPCEQEIVNTPSLRTNIKKQLDDLGAARVCQRIADVARRDYAPLWNGILFAVTTEDYETAANFYIQLEQYCPDGNDPVTGHPLLQSIWREFIIAHEKEKLEAALEKLRSAKTTFKTKGGRAVARPRCTLRRSTGANP